jgi:hypothetical protein
MNPGISSGRRFLRFLLAALAAACLLAPLAQADATRPGGGSLSPRLETLATPAVGAADPAEQAAVLGLAPEGAGSLLREGDRVLVNVRFDQGAAVGLSALRAAGAQIVQLSRAEQTVTVAVAPADLQGVASVNQVGSVTEVLTPLLSAAASCAGAATSEGDAQLKAAEARAAFGVDGSGVTVGILSDSFDRDATAPTHAAGDVASGDLPGSGNPCGRTAPVSLLDDSYGLSDAGDEGRAMGQIVHDLAPGAKLDFATAFQGEASFASNIRALVNAGASVITDDVSYLEEPFFQDGPIAVAVNEAAVRGVSYFSAAGNNNLEVAGKGIASWEAPKFRDSAIESPSASCPVALPSYAKHCMDFNPVPGTTDPEFGITVAENATLTVDLQWAQPWNGVTTDLDAYLFSGSTVLAPAAGKEVHNVASLQRPVEILSWTNKGPAKTVQLAIDRCDKVCDPLEGGDGGTPRLKFALLENGSGVTATEYPVSSGGDTVGPTIFGHNGAEGAITLGAIRYTTTAAPEAFSSRGPETHYFGPALGSSPAAPLASPQIISKPDLAATDGGANTFFGRLQSGVWRFYGTSAAAPHAAAVAALVRQANPGASGAQVRADLTSTARPVGAFGLSDVGAGLIDASAAVSALALPPTVAITKAPPALSRGRRPTIEFSANRPVAFSCAFDGREPQSCVSPFTIPIALADGHHGIVVTGVDQAGRSGSSGVASFAVDTRAPRTSFAKHPRKLIRTHRRKVREHFRFRSNESGVTFVCKIDRSLLHYCRPRISRRFGIGKHTVTVRASDGAGNIDRSPAVFHFTVKRIG